MRAPAGTAAASQEALRLEERFDETLDKLNEMMRNNRAEVPIYFDAVSTPLPLEATRREPISEALRSEVWRRDGGTCVKCGSRENLQYDHIIPVSRGGATTAQNLQLLCKKCNREKAARI